MTDDPLLTPSQAAKLAQCERDSFHAGLILGFIAGFFVAFLIVNLIEWLARATT